MKIGFIINDLDSESPNYTTTRLAYTAHKEGHEVFIIPLGNLAYTPDEQMSASAYTPPDKKFQANETFFASLSEGELQVITSESLDVLLLRNDPADDMITRPWATNAGIIFGQIAERNGVIVLNSPSTLADAMNKMYFQHFPEVLRPRTLISRNLAEIKDFFASEKKKIILKPLQGSGGKNVFMVNEENVNNLSQIVEAINRDGYVICQEYLPAATEGDTRFFLMNGRPLLYQGKYAAFRRVNKKGDIRSNISAGGTIQKAKIDEKVLEMAEVLRPKLIRDGMFLVGIDVVGDKLMEINVFSPGGLNGLRSLEGVDFTEAIIKALEKKVYFRDLYKGKLNNKELAVL